jgi:hypothetical protein
MTDTKQPTISTGTVSNFTIDLTRLDSEYLVQVGPFFWFVRLTETQQRELSDRLAKLSEKLQARYPEDSAWLILNVGAIRNSPEPLSLEEYLKDAEAQ